MTPKRLHVPIQLLDAVCKLTLKKSAKPKVKAIDVHVKPVVMYKMISTEEWNKQQQLKKAENDRVEAKRQKPKLESSILASLGGKGRKRRTKAEMLKKEQEYYFKRKQYMKEYNAKRHLKLTKAKVNPFNELP